MSKARELQPSLVVDRRGQTSQAAAMLSQRGLDVDVDVRPRAKPPHFGQQHVAIYSRRSDMRDDITAEI